MVEMSRHLSSHLFVTLSINLGVQPGLQYPPGKTFFVYIPLQTPVFPLLIASF